MPHTHEPKQTVELGKDTKKEILSALTGIRSQLVKQREGRTAKDVAAEALASGAGPLSAIKEAMAFRRDKAIARLKYKFDPLNVINKMTGSKLATAIAGRMMGRSEASIRAAAGLQQRETRPSAQLDEPVSPTTAPTPEPRPSLMEDEQVRNSFEIMTRMLTIIAQRVTNIADKMKAKPNIRAEETRLRDLSTGRFVSREVAKTEKDQTDYLKRIWEGIDTLATTSAKEQDRKKDQLAEDRYEQGLKERKAAVVKESLSAKAPDDKESWIGGLFKGLMKTLMGSLFSPLGLAFAGLVTAGIMLYKQWDKLKLSMSMLGDSISEIWESIKSGVSSIGTWVVDTFTSITDSILDIGESMIEKVKELNPFYKAPTAEEKQKELEETAKGEGYAARRAQRKIAKQNTEKLANPDEAASAVSKFAPTVSGKVPSQSMEGLQRGDYDTAAINSLMGVAAPSGTPEDKATVQAITQLAAKSYGQVFKDEQGNPLSPLTDKTDKKGERVAEMVKAASKALAQSSLTTPTMMNLAGPKVSEVPPAPPDSGIKLSEAANMKAESEMGRQAASFSAPTVNNISTNNVNNNNIQQKLPNPRGSDSSYMRHADRNFSPA